VLTPKHVEDIQTTGALSPVLRSMHNGRRLLISASGRRCLNWVPREPKGHSRRDKITLGEIATVTIAHVSPTWRGRVSMLRCPSVTRLWFSTHRHGLPVTEKNPLSYLTRRGVKSDMASCPMLKRCSPAGGDRFPSRTIMSSVATATRVDYYDPRGPGPVSSYLQLHLYWPMLLLRCWDFHQLFTLIIFLEERAQRATKHRIRARPQMCGPNSRS